jgi:hypothetical protein
LEGRLKSGRGGQVKQKKKSEWKSKQRSAIEPERLLKRREGVGGIFPFILLIFNEASNINIEISSGY